MKRLIGSQGPMSRTVRIKLLTRGALGFCSTIEYARAYEQSDKVYKMGF
jgi:hypothetical protein